MLPSTLRVVRFPFGSFLQFPSCDCPLAVASARAARTAYGLKSRTTTGDGIIPFSVTTRWPAVVVMGENCGESFKDQRYQRVAEGPHADHGTCTSGGGARAEQNGIHARCTGGI